MLQLDFASALVDKGAAAGRQTGRVPKADGGLHPCLVLTCAEGRVRVQSPIATGRVREADLKEHADEGHRGDADMLQLDFTSALAMNGAAAGRQAVRVPEADEGGACTPASFA